MAATIEVLNVNDEFHPEVIINSKLSKNIRVLKNSEFFLNRDKDSSSQTFWFESNGIRFCNELIKSTKLSTGQIIFTGKIPRMELNPEQNVMEYQKAFNFIKVYLKKYLLDPNHTLTIKKAEPCFLNDQDQMEIVWEFITEINQLPYKLKVNHKGVFELKELFFSFEGTAEAFDTNSVMGSIQNHSIKTSGEGRLINEFFDVVSNSKPRAYSKDHNFIYDENDNRFIQANTFVHANDTLDYFKRLGFQWKRVGPLKITNHADAKIGFDTNSAAYIPLGEPGSGSGYFLLGDGDGYSLRNLGIDSDVMGHEFSHFVIYEYLSNENLESAILHEGLADFFMFAKQGNSCLGESICPEGSSICWVENQCLRTADNEIKFDTEEYENLIFKHKKSQVISGLLWDLYEQGISLDVLDRMVFKSLKYLNKNSGFKDFFLSLLISDSENFEKVHACEIFETVENRGFGKLLNGTHCLDSTENWLEQIGGLSLAEKPAILNKAGPFQCGTLGFYPHSQGGQMILCLLFMPFILLLIRKK